MERPINIKPRQNAILKFIFACMVALMLVGYHVLITQIVCRIEVTNNKTLEAPPE